MDKFAKMFKILKADFTDYKKNKNKASEKVLNKDFALIMPLEDVINGDKYFGDLESAYVNYQKSLKDIHKPKAFKADIARAIDEAFTMATDCQSEENL